MDGRPVDGIDYAEARRILNRSTSYIGDRIRDGTLSRGPRHKQSTLSRAEVECLALKHWRPRRRVPGGYWCTRGEAAGMLGVSSSWVSQLAAQDRLPVVYPETTRHLLFRRSQIEVIAKTWTARAAAADTSERLQPHTVTHPVVSDSSIGVLALERRDASARLP